jgi:hypothetical protein
MEFNIEFVVVADHILEQADEVLRATIHTTNANCATIRRVAKACIDEADELKRSAQDFQANMHNPSVRVQLQTLSPLEVIEMAKSLIEFQLPNKDLQEKIRAVAKSYVLVGEKNRDLYAEFQTKYRDELKDFPQEPQQ